MKYVIIGDGTAGATAAEKIRNKDNEASIKVFTDESQALYNRIMLKTFMKGTLPAQYTQMHDEDWYEKKDIDLHLETRVEDVKDQYNTVISEDGEEYSYDKLLVATGGSPREYPLDEDFENLHYMWTMKDAEEIKESAENSEKAVVIGGGLLGIDLAVAYAENDCETYYLIRGDRWWNRGISKKGAEIIHRKLEEKGVNVITETEASSFEGEEKIEKVLIENKEFEVDAVAVAIGQTPNSEIVDIEKNEASMIKVDENLQTSDKDIFAAGNLVEYYSPVLEERTVKGSWDHSEAMGEYAADNMLGEDRPFNFINTYGVGHFDVQFLAIGDWTGEPVEKKYSEDEYRRLFFKNDRLVGAVMIGFTKGQEKIKDLIRDKEKIDDREALLDKSYWE
ncbi:Ferredoxin--NAD(+) reductase [Candidatus Haloredivivus sp. G17]|jgi:3-phenylpropionate/trans-cinnamate dioxygenase ferredoxin reductase subunit|nr:Ferredoxin--NAD(+) reductase [Candidatus Haloredivivus sp. G17]